MIGAQITFETPRQQMTSEVSPGAQAIVREPTFGATVLYRQHSEIRLTQLFAALQSFAPAVVMGDWKGPFTTPPTDDQGVAMLSVDGIRLSVLNISAPPPSAFFDSGLLPNALLPNAALKLGAHRAHVIVMPAKRPADHAAAIATARAVMLLTWAVAKVTQAEALKWEDANNLAPVTSLSPYVSNMLPADGMMVPAWVRILVGRAHGQQKLMAGTYGLWAFGVPEIEYAPCDLPIDFLVMHAYAICEYLLKANKSMKNGDTIGADDRGGTFRIEALQPGFFTRGPALRLSLIQAGPPRSVPPLNR